MKTINHKTFVIGRVVSNKMTNTVVVEVTRWVTHPIYKKRHMIHKKYHAHDEIGAKIGAKVALEQTRPISKTKHWKVKEIL